ncbi:MAG: 50S ribosomal protein L6 [Cytophagales bacterium]|nr:50S ribosomal protein L6 [Cytophagales bacterium]MDW8385243.1 50S ribosomal protein L6 [Flammeovirgaceae bacterium]
MSRIGKKPIEIPAGVTVSVSDGLITVKGPKGTLQQPYKTDISVEVKDGKVFFSRPSDSKEHRALHGLYRALVANMVKGVTTGYKLEMELVGVGYKASNQGNLIELSLGYSHSVYFMVPPEIKVSTAMEKGKNPSIVLEGIDKQLIGHVAAEIRRLRKPEPYKGKGIKFVDEVIRRKAGKTSAKK